ncbi:hypothetical protein BVX93_00955 [bacterium B13(2017)]|nr:hypothetical protein BVX93_00955 [bacterium B13(2017)]
MYLKICFNCLSEEIVKDQISGFCPVCNSKFQFFDGCDKLTYLHADMDAFFANVEILDNPELEGKPVIVGGDPKSRSVVSTCSYEARKYGVHSAMPLYKAKKLCPNGLFIYPRMERYVEISKQVFKIFETFTPDFEPLSIDEAFLDLKGTESLFGHPIISALKLKNKIHSKLGITVSIGVAHNKFLAKLASDEKKPNGLFVLTPKTYQSYLDNLKIEKMWGIGRKTVPILKRNNIYKIKDLRICSESKLKKIFKNQWIHFYRLSRGQDERIVETTHTTKSVGHEVTLQEDIRDKNKMLKILWELSEKVARRLNRKNLRGSTLTIKLKTSNFKLITRSITKELFFFIDIDIYETAINILNRVDLTNIKVRLLGISVSNFQRKVDKKQLTLFENNEMDPRKEKLNQTINALKDKFGEKAITRALSIEK